MALLCMLMISFMAATAIGVPPLDPTVETPMSPGRGSHATDGIRDLFSFPWEISSYGMGSSGDSVCNFTGGINIASDLPEYPKLDSEWILKENSDVIIKSLAPGSESADWNSTDEAAAILQSHIEGRPGWSNLDAIVGDAYYAKWLHPEIDIDPLKIYKEYLEEFMGLAYPEGVVLGYPEK